MEDEDDWPSSVDHYQLNFPIGLGACGLVSLSELDIIDEFLPRHFNFIIFL